MLRLLIVAIIVIAVPVALAGCQVAGIASPFVQPGVLQGHVSIGPLTPVERIGVAPPTVSPEVYAARQVVLYQADGKTIITRLKLDANGNYKVNLAPGTYVVGMAAVGIDSARGLPTRITIESDKTTTLDISVDTGIR